MNDYITVKSITLYALNNAEYITFMNHVLNLARGEETEEEETPDVVSLSAGDGVPELGLSEELLTGIEADMLSLSDTVDESQTSDETEEMETHEKNRNSLTTYILTRVTQAGTLPLETERQAGKSLYKKLKPYVGVTRLPVSQKTAKIRGLLIDLRKTENAPNVTTLGLDIYVTELEKENEEYNRLAQQRSKARAANKKESGAAIRERVDKMYENLALLAQSYNIVQPTERSTAFVKELNQLITETIAAYKQRKNSGKSETEEPDTPAGEEGTDLPFEPVDPKPEEGEETPGTV